MASAASRLRCVMKDVRRIRFHVAAQPILIRACGKKISTRAQTTPAKLRLLVRAEVWVRLQSGTHASGVRRTRDVLEHAGGVRAALLASLQNFSFDENRHWTADTICQSSTPVPFSSPS